MFLPLATSQYFYRLSQNRSFRVGLRVFRVGVVGFTLFEVGRTSGIHDYVRDPQKFDNALISEALETMRSRSVELVHPTARGMSVVSDFVKGEQHLAPTTITMGRENLVWGS